MGNCTAYIRRIDGKITRTLDAALSERGITKAHIAFLTHIHNGGGADVPLETVEKSCGIAHAPFARVMRELEERKLVSLGTHPLDMARKTVSLTRIACAALEAVTETQERTESELLAPLSADERRTFIALLGKVAERC